MSMSLNTSFVWWFLFLGGGGGGTVEGCCLQSLFEGLPRAFDWAVCVIGLEALMVMHVWTDQGGLL